MKQQEELEGHDYHLVFHRKHFPPLRSFPTGTRDLTLDGVRRPQQYSGAACAELEPEQIDEVFFPEKGARLGGERRRYRKHMLDLLCTPCPFRQQCLIAGENEEGAWGGHDKMRRKKIWTSTT